MTLPPQLQTLLTKLNAARTAYHEDPARDWLILLSILLALFLGSLAWNVVFFFETVREENTAANTIVTETHATDPIESAEALFEKRTADRALYDAAGFVDPSR